MGTYMEIKITCHFYNFYRLIYFLYILYIFYKEREKKIKQYTKNDYLYLVYLKFFDERYSRKKSIYRIDYIVRINTMKIFS